MAKKTKKKAASKSRSVRKGARKTAATDEDFIAGALHLRGAQTIARGLESLVKAIEEGLAKIAEAIVGGLGDDSPVDPRLIDQVGLPDSLDEDTRPG